MLWLGTQAIVPALTDGDHNGLRYRRKDHSGPPHLRNCGTRYSTALERINFGGFPSIAPANSEACRRRCGAARERIDFRSFPSFAFAEPSDRRSRYRATWERI